MIYLLTAIGLPPGGSSTVHIYAQTIHITTQCNIEQHNSTYNKRIQHRTTQCDTEQHNST